MTSPPAAEIRVIPELLELSYRSMLSSVISQYLDPYAAQFQFSTFQSIQDNQLIAAARGSPWRAGQEGEEELQFPCLTTHSIGVLVFRWPILGVIRLLLLHTACE